MSTWTLAYDSFEPEQEGVREALTSTGNGYICSRGCAEWEDTGGAHYAGTYTHGGYNRETTIMAGRAVLNEDLVNLANWLVLKLRIEDDEPFRLDGADVLDYRHSYDILTATVSRSLRFRDGAGRETSLASRRFVSMADRHWAAIEWTITPENWSGHIEVITALDGRVTNRGVARYEELEGRHLDPLLPRTFGPEVIGLKVRTRQSQIHFGQAARTRILDAAGEPVEVTRELHQMEDYIHQTIGCTVEQGAPVRVEKMVALYNSRDHAMSEPLTTAGAVAARAPSFADAWARHRRAWAELWERCGVEVADDDETQLRVNLHIAHILQVCSRHTTELDAGVPARGLNGEAYRGHIFWDELYIYPFLNYRLPEITRSLLMYRCHRLEQARAAAADAGYRGAMFPWQSGSDGTEETQVVHLNPRNGRWEPDLSHNQRHVNAAIFYNIWQYFQATGDMEFLSRFGAEVMLEITRFWTSLTSYNDERGRYEIHGVMGPDEFHEKYPDTDEDGLRNNAYTNVMVAWLADVSGRMLASLPERRRRRLWDAIGLTEAEVAHWAELARRMYVPFHADEHGEAVLSQFEGYERLEELDWDAYRAEYGNIQRLDRILRAEDDTPDRYKLAKQADTLMLFYAFSDTQLREIFARLGYEYGPDTARRNVAYYEARTTHGSTLSYIVHAHVLARFDPERSWEMFRTALDSDLNDVQGGTTAEGIHLGVMAGTLDLMQRGYLGVETNGELLRFAPSPVPQLAGQTMIMRFRDTVLKIASTPQRLRVTRVDDSPSLIWIAVGDTIRETRAGQQVEFPLDPAAVAADLAAH